MISLDQVSVYFIPMLNAPRQIHRLCNVASVALVTNIVVTMIRRTLMNSVGTVSEMKFQ